MIRYAIFKEHNEVNCLLEDVQPGILVRHEEFFPDAYFDHDPELIAEFDNLPEALKALEKLKSKVKNLGKRCQLITEYELIKDVFGEDGDIIESQSIAVSKY